jgi:hypothetical protein
VFPPQVLEMQSFGDRIHLTVEDEFSAKPHIIELLENAGVTEPRIERIQPSMEDVFMAKMGIYSRDDYAEEGV